MKSTLLTAVAAAAMIAAPALAQQSSSSNSQSSSAQSGSAMHLTQQDEAFAKDATIGNLTEMRAGQYAEQHGASPAVREFGRWLYADHSLAQNLLKITVRRANVSLPTSLDQQHQQMVEQLEKANGRQLDQQFAQMMVQDHQADIGKFEQESRDGNGPLKAYAILFLPALRAHLTEAQDLQRMGMSSEAMGAGGNGGTAATPGSAGAGAAVGTSGAGLGGTGSAGGAGSGSGAQ